MQSRLPSLNAIRAFEAAARHLSFKSAAAELHVSPSAISHQIRQLETELGVALFVRRSQAIVLTEEAARMLPHLTAGFDLIRRSITPAVAQERVLHVTMLPTIATRWFLPRLQRLYSRHEGFRVTIDASTEVASLGASPFDCAIRNGKGTWPGLEAERLFDETLTPVCSPGIAPGHGQAGFGRHPLLHLRSRPNDWPHWFAAAGIGADGGGREIWFSARNLAIQAAIEGLGYALIDPRFVAGELADGRLVLPYAGILSAGVGAYYLAYHADLADDRVFQRFRTWLLEEATSHQRMARPRRRPRAP